MAPVMWRRLAMCCVLLGTSAVALSGFQRAAAKSDEEILVALEHQWNEAFYRKDARFIESILADEFIATYEDGTRGDKAMELALMKAFDQHVESALQDEFTVKVYGDTAVVWFTLHLTGVRQGEPAKVTLRYTDVFVMRAGNWQCVSSQSTKVADGS
jgi:ketosteroid isomerase-like protein